MLRSTLPLLLLMLSPPAAAEPLRGLELPVACALGTDCWVLRYVDHDPGPGVRDYACGRLAGDGHKGTDFAIRDLALMTAGIVVRAAAPGIVDGLRDGVPDVSVEDGGRAATRGKECGNGVRLAHGDGWTTWYCHLRRGSVMVRKGDRVEVGQTLGLVGLSGDTSFPHLHFDIRHGERVIDPFVGLAGGDDCAPGRAPLWAPEAMAQLAYAPVVLTNAGFATTAPKKEDARRGWHQPASLSVASPALVLWVEGFWIEQDDRVTFRLLGPDAVPLIEHQVEIEQSYGRWFGFAGAPRPGPRWPAGTYTGEISLERAAADPAERVRIERAVELLER